jgi:hypothetical protein
MVAVIPAAIRVSSGRRLVSIAMRTGTPGQPHPVEGGIDVGQRVVAVGVIAISDAARDVGDRALQLHDAGHQADVDRVAHVQPRQLGFFELARIVADADGA